MKKVLTEYCFPGTKITEEMVCVSENVSLKVITFTPPKENSNPKVLFVPGWISMIDGWKEVLIEMTKDFVVHYVETREKISSKVSNQKDFSVERIGKDLVEVVSKLNLKEDNYIFFGSSLGATAILDCCRYLKTNPACLILVGPNAEFRIPNYGKILIKLFYPPMYNFFKPYVKWYLKTFRLDTKNDYAQYEKYSSVLDFADPWKLKKAAQGVSNYSVWNRLKEIEFPVLVLGASKDKLHSPENLKKIVDSLNNSTYVEMTTNKNTHSKEVVIEIRKYLSSNFN
jgi:pimeloyl-ACP methyl ester carboxylesterase